MPRDKLANLPDKPGVYLMKDDKGAVIYGGKAINLKNRVKSYFLSQHADDPKTRLLVKNIADLEWILTDTEIEALILESNLIKKHKPKYNIRLTDDKHYPYLCVTLQEEFPRLEIVRSVKKDGARYFGPYTDSGAVHETIRLLKKIFPLRSCKQAVLAVKERPCLNAHIGQCLAPCCGRIEASAYRKIIAEVILFLEGKQEDLVKLFSARMESAAAELRFEKAAEIRDQLLAVEKIIAKQKIISTRLIDMDVINLARHENESCLEVFFVRSGKLHGRDHFFLQGPPEVADGELLGAFIKQYYSGTEYIPSEILLPQNIEEKSVLADWLGAKRGARVSLKTPQKGDKRDLLELVGKNANESLQQALTTKRRQESKSREALAEITAALFLPREPERIECFDISHIQGTETVASMVVFEQGRAVSAKYRRFKIKTTDGPDDFAAMAEVLRRRLNKAAAGDEKFLPLPDLIIVDGGKGQLSAALAAANEAGAASEAGLGPLALAALAKENEWLFLPDRQDPLILPRGSEGLFLLQRIRDEAHRYAITYHRLLRGKRSLTSALDEIPGIGPKRKAALLRHFGLSLKKITLATGEELAGVEGISRETARQIWNYFHPSDLTRS